MNLILNQGLIFSFLLLSLAEYRRIVAPVPTRWNSLAMCIESVVKMRVTFRALAAETGHDMHEMIPSDRQFDVLENLLQPLNLIKGTSERFSAEKPSMHIVLLSLFNILTMSLEPTFAEESQARQDFVKAFEKEFLKRIPDYGRSVREYCIGNFLHPTYKGQLLQVPVGDHPAKEYDPTVEFIKDLFVTRVAETEAQPMDVDDVEESPSILNVAMDETAWSRTPFILTQNLNLSQPRQRETSAIEKEIETYLHVLPRHTRNDLDILTYWKSQEKVLPLLAKVARKYCGIPLTSASSERLFSTAGNVITSGRTLLNTEKAEQLIFIHDNYWEVEPYIKNWKIRTDKEKAKEKQRREQTKARRRLEDNIEAEVDEPQPGEEVKRHFYN